MRVPVCAALPAVVGKWRRGGRGFPRREVEKWRREGFPTYVCFKARTFFRGHVRFCLFAGEERVEKEESEGQWRQREKRQEEEEEGEEGKEETGKDGKVHPQQD